MNLINDILIRAGVITEISKGDTRVVEWFKDITTTTVVFSFIMPLVFFLAFSCYLKMRYNKKRERDEITLRPFMNLAPPLAAL
jgi:heme/copper-type cytochrome/quinol oxidase subunit 2